MIEPSRFRRWPPGEGPGKGTHLLPKHYEDIESCGITGQGQAIKATDRNTRKRVVIKKIILQSDAKYAYRELLLLGMANHNNVINLLSAYTPENTLDAFKSVYLVMPCTENTLDRLIEDSKRQPLTENQILNIMYKVVWGVDYLHTNDIIHRDLKPQNIGIDASGDPIIFDFGLARAITELSITRCGTLSYMAPEFLYLSNKGELSKSVDIWSLGCIWIEMINRRRFIPYCRNDTDLDLLNKLLSLLGTPEPEFINKMSEMFRHWFTSKLSHRQSPRPWDELIPTASFHESVREDYNHVAAVRDAIENMMKYNPEKRWNTQRILEHFRDGGLSEEYALIPELIDNTEEFKDACRAARGDNRLWKKLLYNRIKKLEREHATMPPQLRCNRILFYLLYGERDNREGRICLFNSNTFEVEMAEKFSTCANPFEVATGEDKIFLINRYKKVFEIFNYETEQLTKGPDPPEWRGGANVVYYKDKLYYIGWEDSNNHQDSNYVNILVNGEWQRRPDFPIDMKFYRHAICNDKLYIICKDAVFQLSDDEREWIEVGKMEEWRGFPTIASLNGKIYITGGFNGKVLNSCLCFDPSQPFDRRFTPIKNMYFNRHFHSLVVANRKLYVIGGCQKVGCDEFCKSVEEYDPATNRWRIVGEIDYSK